MCVCVCVMVCVWWCVCVSVSEQNSSRTEAPIWTRFLLNGCLLHWLGPYWNWWHWVKSQGQSDTISIFFFTILFLLIYTCIYITVDLSYLVLDQNEIRYVTWICPGYQTCTVLQFLLFVCVYVSHIYCL